MKKLDIIVTHYREPWQTGKPLFDILALQRGVGMDEFRVILVNDGEEYHLDDSLLAGYPYEITQIDIPHGGISAARNAGMDASVSEWINFCDFDDSYTNIYALKDVLSLLPAENFDLLWAHLLSDNYSIGQSHLIEVANKTIWVFLHGKFYRRQWLVDHGMRFDTRLSYQEDSLFNAMILARMPYRRIGEIRAPFFPYAWIRTRGSVTTKDGHKDPAEWGHFFRNKLLTDYYREWLPEDRLHDMVVRTCFDTYYALQEPVSPEMRKQITDAFREYLREYGQFYRKPEEEILRGIEEISWQELEHAEQIHKVGYTAVTLWKDTIAKEKE